MLNPPAKIDVLGKKFKVKKMGPDLEPDSDGMMDLSGQTIWYREQPSLEYNQDTITHEMIHCIDESLVLGLKEKQVHQLATTLLAVIKHNPELVNWLLQENE